MSKLSWIMLVAGVALAGGCSSNPKPDDASNKTEDTSSSDQSEPSDPGQAASAEPTGEPDAPPAPSVKSTGLDRKDDNTVPDDYSLTERDCVELGKKKTELVLAHYRSQVGAKVTQKQREAAEAGFQSSADKDGEAFANGCIKSLVGKVVDRAVLKCAMSSKEIKEFEKCLN